MPEAPVVPRIPHARLLNREVGRIGGGYVQPVSSPLVAGGCNRIRGDVSGGVTRLTPASGAGAGGLGFPWYPAKSPNDILSPARIQWVAAMGAVGVGVVGVGAVG
eukprot:CAMPEP_0173175950 /NCGR_PEP_ID=MMETSP1141-20130122/4190_1 /TAXON_ID=483371 /ORGANISM="non described non described, Strain CCMP2298" /LENGTH=104 /DNA_ID=CAMNT_0014098237 /DNA_START=409 /DNA_END=719 /DNA_ORIENTATION=+